MTEIEILKARHNYCSDMDCDNCLFRTYARDKFNTSCYCLTPYQICDILSIIKEDKVMTKKEEIQKEIEKTQKQLAALQEKLKEAENEVPDVLPFDIGDELFTVSIDGKVHEFRFTDSKEWDGIMRESHRAFKSKNYAKEFAEKTQIIADMLHFKWLYDRDYKPNWALSKEWKWTVIFDHAIYKNGKRLNKYNAVVNQDRESAETIYFSTQELAERCAEWLNKKYGYTKE